MERMDGFVRARCHGTWSGTYFAVAPICGEVYASENVEAQPTEYSYRDGIRALNHLITS